MADFPKANLTFDDDPVDEVLTSLLSEEVRADHWHVQVECFSGVWHVSVCRGDGIEGHGDIEEPEDVPYLLREWIARKDTEIRTHL